VGGVIANKKPDLIYKQGPLKYESWQIVLAGLVSGAAVMGRCWRF
jgi:hypothetical protein